MWFHVVQMRSGLESAYEIAMAVEGGPVEKKDPDQPNRANTWTRYPVGGKVPTSMKGKRDTVAMAEEAYPGTARWFNSPIWPALKRQSSSPQGVENALHSLSPAVQILLFESGTLFLDAQPNPHGFDKWRMAALLATNDFDVLAAAVLLYVLSEHRGSPQLRLQAQWIYVCAQPMLGRLPETAPFFDELLDMVESVFPLWPHPRMNDLTLLACTSSDSKWAARYRSDLAPGKRIPC